jgi:tetratricopeptide (TPR) repeat protein
MTTPSNSPDSGYERALQQAQAALQSGRLQEAEWLAGDVLKHRPALPRALQIFGNALLMQGRAGEAVVPLEEAARRAHDPVIDMQAAMALREAGRIEDAIARFERAIKRRPPFPGAFHVYGTLLAELDRYDEAIIVLRRGLDLTPNAADLARLLGDVLANRDDYAGARAAYRQAVTGAPHHIDALWGLARANEALGQFAEAADAFRRMLAIAPDEAAAQIGLGSCLLELGSREEAFALFRAASGSSNEMYRQSLTALVTARRGQFFLRPSAARRFLCDRLEGG